MIWSVFTATFVTIFLAELGDKTQFAALAISSQSKSTLSVWLGTIIALMVAGSIGVLFGSFLGKHIDPQKMKYVSGGAFGFYLKKIRTNISLTRI
ncbi:MAG: TMEM165/GDT1 family protein [Bdellovibrionaceae bacterium]|nr:TMEM165/GDT1 family protein [Pseudobdellovibrionaceae bacterium]